MAYTPRTWQTGDLITAAELNAIEQAAGAAAVAADIGVAGTTTGDALKAAIDAEIAAVGAAGSVTDNGDGTASTTSSSVTDNGDGTALAA